MDLSKLPSDHWATSGAYTPNIYRDQYPTIDPTLPALSQEGKVVLITGASKGIGALGFAPAFAKAKAKAIVLFARNAEGLARTENAIKEISPDTEVLWLSGSVYDETAVTQLWSQVAEKYGHVDVLVNNAGPGSQNALGPIGDVDPANWWHEHELNVKGAMLMTSGFLKLLGKERTGTIITMNSLLATVPQAGVSAYGTAKLSSLRLMEYVAAEYANVTTVSIQPGVVMTDAIVDAFKHFAHDTPELVGGTGVWLATDAARFLSGRFISANWSVDDLVKQKDHILASQDLQIIYAGKFGFDQFKSTQS